MLSSWFGRDPIKDFAYELPAEADFSLSDGIQFGHATKKSDRTDASCFYSADMGAVALLRFSSQKLKSFRHPKILSFSDCLEMEKGYYLVTETCLPLQLYLEQTKLSAEQKLSVTTWGLFQLLEVLRFLHEDVRLNHNGLLNAVFVTPDGDWKLGAFEHATDFRSAKNDLSELAALLWHAYNGFDKPYAPGKAAGKVPQRLHAALSRLARPAVGVTAGALLDEWRAAGGVLRSGFVDTLLFLDEFQLKEAREKAAFFERLDAALDAFPDDMAKQRIVPKLVQAYELADAGALVLRPLLRLGRLLDGASYERLVVPAIVRLFGSPDRATRVRLLERLDDYAPHLRPAVVNEQIYANLATGFGDTSAAVRESTVKAMVSLAPKLNTHNLNVDLMKHLARLQVGDEQGGIRTNTTICLGKIGALLQPKERQRILASAFTRALKDPFAPARSAGILALSATQQFYQLAEIARRLLPSLCALTVDPDKQVRDQAFKAIRGFVEKLERVSEQPDLIAEYEADVMAAGAARGHGGSEKAQQWASWALGALSSRFYKSAPPPLPRADDEPGPAERATADVEPKPSRAPREEPREADNEADERSSGGWDEDDADVGWGQIDDVSYDDSPVSSIAGTQTVTAPTKTEQRAAAPMTSKGRAAEGGALRLGGGKASTAKAQHKDDLLDELLGVASAAPPPPPPPPTQGTTAGSGGWDDADDWPEPEPQPSAGASRAASSRRAVGGGLAESRQQQRRQEAAARNEQRRVQLQAKKAAKGPLKLGASKLKYPD